jgi:hypothetical protein
LAVYRNIGSLFDDFEVAKMARKFVMINAVFLGLLAAVSANAQNAQLDKARAELQAGRDQIIREDLGLSETERAAFWPVYQQYVAALTPLRNRKAELITKFASAYQAGEFTDEFAAWLIEENFAIKAKWMKVQLDYVPQFREVLPVQTVARFFQLENKMDAEVDAQLALALPLVE